MESWGVHLTWLNCKHQCDINGPREKSQFYVFHLLIKVWFLPFNIHVKILEVLLEMK